MVSVVNDHYNVRAEEAGKKRGLCVRSDEMRMSKCEVGEERKGEGEMLFKGW